MCFYRGEFCLLGNLQWCPTWSVKVVEMMGWRSAWEKYLQTILRAEIRIQKNVFIYFVYLLINRCLNLTFRDNAVKLEKWKYNNVTTSLNCISGLKILFYTSLHFQALLKHLVLYKVFLYWHKLVCKICTQLWISSLMICLIDAFSYFSTSYYKLNV